MRYHGCDHREVNVAHPSEEQEMTEQQREGGRQQNSQENRKRAVAEVYRRDRVSIGTEAEERCVAEANTTSKTA